MPQTPHEGNSHLGMTLDASAIQDGSGCVRAPSGTSEQSHSAGLTEGPDRQKGPHIDTTVSEWNGQKKT